MRNGGSAPDPSTQFSLFRLYMIEHPTFHSAQDDEMRSPLEKGVPEGQGIDCLEEAEFCRMRNKNC